MVEQLKYIWLDGELVPWESAKIHVLTHGLHYGLGVFEGIRCYETSTGKGAFFRLEEHVRRLFDSAKVVGLTIPYNFDQVTTACVDIVKENDRQDAYVRPIAFSGDGAMGLYAPDNRVRLAIAAWPWGAYLGKDGIANGIRVKVSSFQRSPINAWMGKAKATGAYLNSILAKREAIQDGYDEAILLDAQGYVAEGSGENIFFVKNSELFTTPTPTVLDGITRRSVIEIAGDKEVSVTEKLFSRDELYLADEAFFTGTAAEITPIREVDGRTIGSGTPGPLTKALQEEFFGIVHGKSTRSEKWLTYL